MFHIVLLLQLVFLGMSGFSATKLSNAKSLSEEKTSIVMSTCEQRDDADNTIRPSVLLTSVERSRDRRRTFVDDRTCYSHDIALASLSVWNVENFYDSIIALSPKPLVEFFGNYTVYDSPRDFSPRTNVVLLI